MTAIYKKEMRSYLTNMTGAVCIAVTLLVFGLMFRYYNLLNGALTLHYAVSGSSIVFYIVVPVLTMRAYAEERKQRTDQLFLTSPVSVWSVVCGKYLALMTIFAIPVAVLCLFPLIMTAFGRETLPWDYAAIAAFFLMGCAYLSVGLFLSCLTESLIIAVIAAVSFVFATQMLSGIYTLLSGDMLSAMLFLAIVAVLLSLLMYLMTRHFAVSVVTLAVLLAALAAAYFIAPAFFTGRTESVLRLFDFSTHFSDFAGGIVTVQNVVYFLSFIAAGLILTALTVDGRRRPGGYAVALLAALSGVLVLVNLIAAELPKKYTTWDVSDIGLYSVGPETREVLDALKEDVTLYYLTENGQEDEAVIKLLDAYAAASDRVRVENVDVLKKPTFAAVYTDETVPLNSVIAACAGASRVVPYTGFYIYDSYGYMSGTPLSWDAEGQITSAIAELQERGTGKVFYTAGHSELPLGSAMTEALEKAGMAAEPLNLLTGTIPAEADALIIFAPGEDFAEAEADKVRAYLREGGRLLLVTASSAVNGAETPLLDSLMEDYGVTRAGGLVMEEDPARYVEAPYILLPKTGAVEVTESLENRNLICALPEALDPGHTDEAPYTVRTVLASGEKAYRKESIADTVLRGEGDETGQFVLALEIEQTPSYDSMGEPDFVPEEERPAAEEESAAEETQEERAHRATRILYYTTPCLFSAEALSALIREDTALPEGNAALFAKSMAYLTDRETAVYVAPKMLEVPQTVVNSRAQAVLGNALMIALPALVFLFGLVIFFRRRRR